MKLNKKDYMAAAFIIGVFFFMFAFSFYAIAGGNHHNTYNTPVMEVSQNEAASTAINIDTKSINDGIAMAASNDHSFDFATNANQLDFNCSRYSDSTACSIAYAKRAGRLLLRASASGVKISDPIISIGFGLRF